MSDKWKDVGPGGGIGDRIMSIDGGEKRTIQDTSTGEYREVYRGPGQTTGEAISKSQFTDKSDSSGSGSNDSGGGSCFLSTACISAMGLPDDCFELLVLRHFRDGYVIAMPNGPDEVQNYYDLAPRIVTAINNRADRIALYELIFNSIVSPCVKFISAGLPDKAFDLYKTQTQHLSDTVLS